MARIGEDGVQADLDLGELIRFEGVFAPLREPGRFAELGSIPRLAPYAGPGVRTSIPTCSMPSRRASRST